MAYRPTLLLLAVTAMGQVPPPSAAVSRQQQAQAQASLGQTYLELNRLDDAKTSCDAAIKLDPASTDAKQCLDTLGSMLADRDLKDAYTFLLLGNTQKAAELSAKWTSSPLERQRQQAWKILAATKPIWPRRVWQELPDWTRQFVLVLLVLVISWLLLLGCRILWRTWQRGRHFKPTKWTLYPLAELGGDKNRTGIATSLVLDALGRLGHELAQPYWSPKLLLLRPTPPADYEPAIIEDFLSTKIPGTMTFAPSPKDLCEEWKLHDIQLDEAVQNLQLKTPGVDFGSVAKLLRGTLEWFKAGSPAIRGVAQTAPGPGDNVYVQLTATGTRGNSAAVLATTPTAQGIDAVQLSTERAAFKFLFRIHYQYLTNEEIDGFAALRQAVTLFSQYATTVPGIGESTIPRTAALTKAAYNFSFFRASIPHHNLAVCGANAAFSATKSNQMKERSSLCVTDEIRQAILLAEGIANALVGLAYAHQTGPPATPEQESENAKKAKNHLMASIDCFRQLEDYPGSEATAWLRGQATYNEAIVWRHHGSVQRSVLALTALLGERAPDTEKDQSPRPHQCCTDSPLSQPVCLLARVARLSGLAAYTLDDWSTFPAKRAELIITDGEQLLKELGELRNGNWSAHDLRIASYLHSECVSALGHVQLMRAKTGPASDRYQHGLIAPGALSKEADALVTRAIMNLKGCEATMALCAVYCDLAEAYSLQGEFGLAQGFARHATLAGNTNAQSERAYFLAAQAAYLGGDKELAKSYATRFHDTISLEEFTALRTRLGL